jgi:hypothetical protein
MALSSRSILWKLVALAVYLAMMAAIVSGLFAARRQTITALDRPESRADWQVWKEATKREAQGKGPVQRRTPKSDEPPQLILLRDHFAVVVTSAVVLTSCLFLFLLIVFAGSIRQSLDGAPRGESIGIDD